MPAVNVPIGYRVSITGGVWNHARYRAKHIGRAPGNGQILKSGGVEAGAQGGILGLNQGSLAGNRHCFVDRTDLQQHVDAQMLLSPKYQAAAHQCAKTGDRKSTRLNSSHVRISYAVFCLKKKKKNKPCPSQETKKRGQAHI